MTRRGDSTGSWIAKGAIARSDLDPDCREVEGARAVSEAQWRHVREPPVPIERHDRLRRAIFDLRRQVIGKHVAHGTGDHRTAVERGVWVAAGP